MLKWSLESSEVNEAVQLAANIMLVQKLAEVVGRVNQGAISGEISDCYFGVKNQLSELAEKTNALRCEVLTDDMKIDDVTFAALWERAQLNDQLYSYQQDNSVDWNEAKQYNRTNAFYDNFTRDAKNRACSEEQESTLAAQLKTAHIAADTCL